MNRKTTVFVGMLLGMAPFLLGQQAQNPTAPRPPEDLLASQQLVAWSWVQKPRPVPQPLPPPGSDPQSPSPAPPQTQQQAQNQTFVGKVMKNSEKYVLQSGGTSYQIDDQNSVKQYENKDVKIVGTLDPGSNTIHVVKIELIS